MKDFNTLGLPDQLVANLSKNKFTVPTLIQEKSIPHALEGRDILGTAQTGTGKTLAFGLPLVNNLLLKPKTISLVITPTRELAVQVLDSLKFLLEGSKINTALLIGGEPITKQIKALDRRPRLIVGTPGRINDHLNKKTLSLRATDFVVLDETDRMLDLGFSIQINTILEYISTECQMLLFSATLPSSVANITQKYLKDPVRVSAGEVFKPAANIKQELIYIEDSEKHNNLLEQLNTREGSVIVFVKTKISADKIALFLKSKNHQAEAIHGNLTYGKRKHVISGFHKCKYRVLVATDIAARGLDIPHIKHVINYDLPQCPEDYIHRIGRTARAGSKGEAICFISSGDKKKWYAIEYLLYPERKLKKPTPEVRSRRSRSPYRENENSSGNRYGRPFNKSSKFSGESGERTYDRRSNWDNGNSSDRNSNRNSNWNNGNSSDRNSNRSSDWNAGRNSDRKSGWNSNRSSDGNSDWNAGGKSNWNSDGNSGRNSNRSSDRNSDWGFSSQRRDSKDSGNKKFNNSYNKDSFNRRDKDSQGAAGSGDRKYGKSSYDNNNRKVNSEGGGDFKKSSDKTKVINVV